MRNKYILFPLVFGITTLCCFCTNKGTGGGGTPPPPPTPGPEAEVWMTRSNATTLLQKQPGVFAFGTTSNSDPFVDVDSATRMQSVDGFGYTLTGGSAMLLNRMNAPDRAVLLSELFGNGASSIGVSYLRLSIGASDLSPTVFSYDDMPTGQTDVTLANFSLSQDTVDLIPVLKEILAINPAIKLMGSPWSPPVWMKDNGSSIGGSLLPQYYSVYAQYFVKYILAMKAKGITIDAITIQNEPQHGGNNPSMLMTATQQADFIKGHLGPAFQAAAITTKIIVWDHNCDNPGYPITVLNDVAARQFINGSAFHLYAGDISALTQVHNAYPDKDLYFTEQWTGANGSFDGDFKWHVKNVVIGSMRNWSKVALEWNLASDQAYNPHTPGGCTECKGAITISGSAVSRNVGYYIIAQASKFVPAGSVRIASNLVGILQTVAFQAPDGKKILIVLNEGANASQFNIRYKGKWLNTSVPAGTASTYIW
ncbi:MAG: glucosylceramidase [Chitinophagaceae bacterium]|nr:glucosylceramidase [Chitinophagaceae bacterium]